MKFSSVQEAVAYLDKFQFHGFRLGLERIEAALKGLGNPHESYPCIHVAGTNGKGSVCAALSFILQEAGYRVGFYSSPHLVKLNERFRINFEPVSDNELKELLEETASLVEKGQELSYFEFTTAMAFSCFRHNKVDIAVIETGLGGRLDATNVITPVVSVITNIAKDHQSYLGHTLEEIAAEKAGIIKEGVPVVTGRLEPTPFKVIEKIARDKKARLRLLGRDFFIFGNTTLRSFNYEDEDFKLSNVKFGLGAGFQWDNAALAIAASRILNSKNIALEAQHILSGLGKTRWPGRSELFRGKPWVFLEGAHNEAGLKGLKATLDRLSRELPSISQSLLLWACSNEGDDKDPASMLATISPAFDKVFITEPSGPRRPVAVEEWQKLAKPPSTKLFKDYRQALDEILAEADENTLVVVAGSLYLVGPVRKELLRLNFQEVRMS